MASNFIPMLSASPPPLDDAGSIEDEDDDFHDFLSASKVLDSPSDSPVKTPATTPIKTVLPCPTPEKNNDEKSQDLSTKLHSKENELSPSFSDFQNVSSHNGTESPDLNSSKEFTEFYTCSSKTTEDDLDIYIPVSDLFNQTEKNSENLEKLVKNESVELKDEEKDLQVVENIEDESREEELNVEDKIGDKTQVIPNENPVLCDDDEFADFESASFDKHLNLTENEFGNDIGEFDNYDTGSVEDDKEELFADFATASFDPDDIDQSFTDFETADNEWADFNTVTSLEKPTFISHDAQQPTHSVSSNQLLQKFVSAFPNSNGKSLCEEIFPKLSETLLSSGKLWLRLEDLDQSTSLRHQWIGSEAFKKTLQSLNIDSRNILRNPTIPLFALGLGPMLEPVKVDISLSVEETGGSSNKPSSPQLEMQENFIPPAQFDWNSSGLVNPLDPTQASSSLLNLDFFNTEYTTTSKSVAKTFSLEEELLGQDSKLDSNDPKLRNQPNQQNMLLEQLMSNIKLSGSSTLPPCRKRSENLSESTIQILKRIPDLSFVKAKVLMFPVHSSDQVS